MTYTPPAPGSLNWNVPLDATLADLDSRATANTATAAAAASAASAAQATANAVTTKVNNVGTFNVKDYGATGDGTTDDTAAIQAAITAAEAAYQDDQTNPSSLANPYSGLAPRVYVPAGAYMSNGLTITKPIAFVGDGPGSTLIRLRAGITTSLLTITASNVAGTSVEDAARVLIADMQLRGNRTDSVTTNSSHGIDCPINSTGVYLGSFTGRDLHIEEFMGCGVFIGSNRGWALMDRVVSRYNNTDGFQNKGSDHRIIASDFAANTGYGVRMVEGTGIVFAGCNMNNNQYGARIDPFTGGWFGFTNCSIGANLRDGLNIAGLAGLHVSVIGSYFDNNSLETNATYSDIATGGVVTSLAVIGCRFKAGSGNKPLYGLNQGGTVTAVTWLGNYADAAAHTSFLHSSSANFNRGTIMPSYTVAGLPTPNPAGQMVYVSNESGGGVMAFSDSANWRRVTDRAIVS